MAERFVNPYTFVPLRNGKKTAPKNSTEDLFTGVIQCVLITKTELVIPETGVPQQDEDHKEFDFFRIDGKLAIPGSSIRGPIRSAYEILTDSCLALSDERMASKSGMKKPGILEKKDGVYILRTATRCRVKDLGLIEDRRSGDFIARMKTKNPKGKGSPIVQDTKNGNESGYLLIANKFNDSHPSIFKCGEELDDDIPSKYIEAFEENVAKYVKNNETVAHFADYQEKLKVFIHSKNPGFMLPVWFSEESYRTPRGKEEWAYQFALSQISRSVYSKTPADFAKRYQPCTDASSLCPACALFGFVRNDSARASKVRFSDALCITPSVQTEKKVLPSLMEPRTSSFEMYLRNTGSRRQSFTPDTNGTIISGRKVYWHHQDGLKPETKWTDKNAKCECVPKGVSFDFSVFFDNITKKQLNELVFTLTLGQYKNPEREALFHKIGRGKPVGCGSVLIEVREVVTRKAADEHYELSSTDTWLEDNTAIEKRLEGFRSYKLAARFNTIGDVIIDYPRNEKEDPNDSESPIFDWFSSNRNCFVDEAGPKYKQTLPLITDPNQAMTRYPGNTKKR